MTARVNSSHIAYPPRSPVRTCCKHKDNGLLYAQLQQHMYA